MLLLFVCVCVFESMHPCVRSCSGFRICVLKPRQFKPPLHQMIIAIHHIALTRQFLASCWVQCPFSHWAIDWVGLGYHDSTTITTLLHKHRLSAVGQDTENMVKSGLEQSRSRSGSGSPTLKGSQARRSDTILNSPDDAGRLAFANCIFTFTGVIVFIAIQNSAPQEESKTP